MLGNQKKTNFLTLFQIASLIEEFGSYRKWSSFKRMRLCPKFFYRLPSRACVIYFAKFWLLSMAWNQRAFILSKYEKYSKSGKLSYTCKQGVFLNWDTLFKNVVKHIAFEQKKSNKVSQSVFLIEWSLSYHYFGDKNIILIKMEAF